MSLHKIIVIFILSLSFFCIPLFSNFTFAVTTSITQLSENIDDKEFTIDIEIEGAKEGVNYLRVDIYKKDTTEYFGETYNGQDFYGGSDYIKYLPVQIASGTKWTGQIKARVGTVQQNKYEGPGQYLLRIRRYTASGNYNSDEANNSTQEITINILLPTQIPDTPTNPAPTTQTVAVSIPPSSYALPDVANIYLWEIMVNPDIGENEWVEILNNNDFKVSLADWALDDEENAGSSPKKFTVEIDPRSLAVIDLSSNIFNNGGDIVRLINDKGVCTDTYIYENSKKNVSFGRVSVADLTFCQQTPSKGKQNNPCLGTQEDEKSNETDDQDKQNNVLSPQTISQTDRPTSGITTIVNKKNYPWLTFAPAQTTGIVGQVMGETHEIPLGGNVIDYYLWIQSLSACAAGISLLNVGYILNKILISNLEIPKNI